MVDLGAAPCLHSDPGAAISGKAWTWWTWAPPPAFTAIQEQRFREKRGHGGPGRRPLPSQRSRSSDFGKSVDMVDLGAAPCLHSDPGAAISGKAWTWWTWAP